MARTEHLYTNPTITANGTRTGSAIDVPAETKSISMESLFVVGSGGGTEKVYLQSTLDGTTWYDISQHAFTTASANKVSLVTTAASITATAVTDGVLSDNTNAGIFGKQIRIKEISASTVYGGTTTLDVYVQFNQ